MHVHRVIHFNILKALRRYLKNNRFFKNKCLNKKIQYILYIYFIKFLKTFNKIKIYKLFFFCICNFNIRSSFAERLAQEILHINCTVWQQVATATATKNVSCDICGAYITLHMKLHKSSAHASTYTKKKKNRIPPLTSANSIKY